MHALAALSEHHMVAAFLKAELASERCRDALCALLHRGGYHRSLVDEPDLTNEKENSCRLKLLGEFRGYGQDRNLFKGFPDDVSWHRYAISAQELARVRYVDYSYWNELSGGSRLPGDAARNVCAGAVVFGQSPQRFLDAARWLENGAKFPELILVGEAAGDDLVVLEGHLRLTAYLLAPGHIPPDLTAILGFSSGLRRWMAL